ncbi:hypothetical protein EV286_107538 [Rhizobium sp. BK251]|nr:hypothetical protein EV286_107538 [Rhizobium sp. BK251]
MVAERIAYGFIIVAALILLTVFFAGQIYIPYENLPASF